MGSGLSSSSLSTSATAVSCLGKGRFGTVNCFLTADKTSLFAGKVYTQEEAQKWKRKIDNEIEVLGILSNQGASSNEFTSHEVSSYIVEFFGSFTNSDDGSLCVYMEAVLGGSLDRHILATVPNGHFDLLDSLNYLVEMVSAIKFMSERCCVHRDIKANNVLISGTGHVKFVDFGSAKCLFGSELSGKEDTGLIGYQSQKGNVTVLSNVCEHFYQQQLLPYCDMMKTFSIVGSKHNMAPEMLLLAKDASAGGPITEQGYNTAVDWYALGVLFFEMLTGGWPAEYEDSLSFDPDTHRKKVKSAVDELELQLRVHDALGASLVEPAMELLRGLLCSDPDARLGGWGNMEAVLGHTVFAQMGVHWTSVDSGVSFPPDFNFNKKVGNLDLIELFCANESSEETKNENILTEVQQDLFADF